MLFYTKEHNLGCRRGDPQIDNCIAIVRSREYEGKEILEKSEELVNTEKDVGSNFVSLLEVRKQFCRERS